MSGPGDRRVWWVLLAALALAALLFTALPAVDLKTSALFYRQGAGFPLARAQWLETARQLIWDLSLLVFGLAAAGLLAALMGRGLRGLSARFCGFVLTLYLIGPALLVNGILKSHWGRARPADVTEFGGKLHFTPPLWPSDQCLSNCSFVSGEAASAVVLGLVMLMAGRRLLAPHGTAGWLWGALAWALPALAIFQRVATGRHFLSDVTFAGLFMLTIALVLHRLFLAGEGPRGSGPAR